MKYVESVNQLKLNSKDSKMSTETNNEKPDYEVARDELHTLMQTVIARGNHVSISDPFPDVHDTGDKAWPCIGFNVTIGKTAFPWFVGIGHVKVPKGVTLYGVSPTDFALKRCGAQYDDSRYFFHGNWDKCDPKESARMAVVLAKYQKLQPDVSEVLARVCEDGRGADIPFEEWASEFGYNTDSIKALNTYNECTRLGKLARCMLSREEFEQFADLACRL